MAEVKIMYVAPRPAHATAAGFARRWREHAGLALADDAWRAAATWYEFFDPVDVAEPGLGLSPAAQAALRAPDDLGGVCIVRFGDPDALGRRLADPAFARLLYEDERVAFGRRLDRDLFPVDERVLRDVDTPALAVIGVLHRHPDIDAAAFADAWASFGRRLLKPAATRAAVCRYRQNLLPAGAPYDGIVELGFRSAEAAVAYLDDPARRAVSADASGAFVDAPRTARFLARSEILHRAPRDFRHSPDGP